MLQQPYAVGQKPSLAKAILLTGLIAGTIDALFAIASFVISNHANPVIIFWYIASGAIHNEPPISALLTADIGTQVLYAVIGLLLHYFIAFAFIAFLFIIYPVLKRALHYNLIIALVYGTFVWLVMNYGVLPLAFNGQMPIYTVKTILTVLYLVVAIGLVGAAFAAKYYERENA